MLLIPRVCSLQYCLIPPCVTEANGGKLSSSRPRDGGCGDCLWGRSERDAHRAAGQKELRERRAPSLGEFPLNTPRSEVENTKMTSARRRGRRVVGPPVRFRPNALLVPAATFSDHTVSSWCAHARHACLHRNQAAERWVLLDHILHQTPGLKQREAVSGVGGLLSARLFENVGWRLKTIGDPLYHVLGGSITFDGILIALLSCVCLLSWPIDPQTLTD